MFSEIYSWLVLNATRREEDRRGGFGYAAAGIEYKTAIVKLQITQTLATNQAQIEPADFLCLYRGGIVVNEFKYGFKQGWEYYTLTGSWEHNQICQNI